MLRPTYHVEPVYPPEARSSKVEGWVELGMQVDEDGNVTHAEVLSSRPAGVFDDAAMAAVMQWRYCRPGDVAQPYPDRIPVRFRFKASG